LERDGFLESAKAIDDGRSFIDRSLGVTGVYHQGLLGTRQLLLETGPDYSTNFLNGIIIDSIRFVL
jgi:hypothetical protein